MTVTLSHWTSNSFSDFIYRIASDFIVQLEKRMEAEGINQKTLAARLGVSVGRVSQVFTNPGNLTLKKIVEYARHLGLKVAVVAYSDGDVANEHGPPINAEIFQICWDQSGQPRDFFDLKTPLPESRMIYNQEKIMATLSDFQALLTQIKTAQTANLQAIVALQAEVASLKGQAGLPEADQAQILSDLQSVLTAEQQLVPPTPPPTA